MRSSELYAVEVAEGNRRNGKKMMLASKMPGNFPEMKGMKA